MKSFLEKLNKVFKTPPEEEEEDEIPFEKQSRSTQIATTIGSYRTAITKLKKINPNIKTVLDYGAGLGLGADAVREVVPLVHTWEPNPEDWQSKSPLTYTSSNQIKGPFDAVICLNVLNVTPQSIRDSIVSKIGKVLSPGGLAAIGTRSWNNDIKKTSPKNSKKGPEPKSVIIFKKEGPTLQKGFDGEELVEYLKSILGPNFDVRKMTKIGKSGAVIRKIK